MPGSDIRLTLDANVQDRAEEVLAEVGEEWQPKYFELVSKFRGGTLYGFTLERPEVLPFRAFPGWMRFFPVPDADDLSQ